MKEINNLEKNGRKYAVKSPTKEEWAKLYGNSSTNYEWLEPILAYSGNKVLEIGCGSGLLSKKLRELGYNAFTNDINGIDSDTHKVFDVTKEWDDEQYDTTFSCGLLEHFEDKDIVKILKNSIEHSNVVISLVPFDGCKGYWEWRNKNVENGTWNYGDERTFNTLTDLYNKAGMKVINEYKIGNDFGDNNYLLVTIGEIK